MNIWIAKDGSHWVPQPLETIPKPITFPRFVQYPNELPTARAQRWRRTFKDLSEKQHAFVISACAWALKDAKSQQALDHILKDLADQFVINQDLSRFVFSTADQPLELTVLYQLTGSSRTHQLTFSLLSPSQMDKQCKE